MRQHKVADLYPLMVTHQQSFVRVPLLLRYNFNYDSDNSFVPYIAVGASYDYLLNAKYLEGNRTGGTEYKFDSDLSLKGLDLADGKILFLHV